MVSACEDTLYNTIKKSVKLITGVFRKMVVCTVRESDLT